MEEKMIITEKTEKINYLPKLTAFVVFFALVFNTLSAQGLAARIDYLRDLQRQALQAETEGRYDRSIELARQIRDESDFIDALMETTRNWYVLKNRIATAKQVFAERYAKEEYDLALERYDNAYTNISEEELSEADKNIEEGIYYADLAIEKSRELYTQAQNESKKAKETSSTVIVKAKDDGYEVRLIPGRRDSLWRIAEYEFIYNDPFLWPQIYEANRDIIRDPDLIYPGQFLKIPPVVIDAKELGDEKQEEKQVEVEQTLEVSPDVPDDESSLEEEQKDGAEGEKEGGYAK